MAPTVKRGVQEVVLNGKHYSRTTWQRMSRAGTGVIVRLNRMYQVRDVNLQWRALPPRCTKIRARINVALDNPQTSD